MKFYERFDQKRGNNNIFVFQKKNVFLSYVIMLCFLIIGCGGGTNEIAQGGSIITSTGSVTSTTLQWDPPTTNRDGSALGDLAGYILHYGPSEGTYSHSVDVGSNTYVSLGNLGIQSGTWCFAVSAYDYSGNESSYSNEVCADINI